MRQQVSISELFRRFAEKHLRGQSQRKNPKGSHALEAISEMNLNLGDKNFSKNTKKHLAEARLKHNKLG